MATKRNRQSMPGLNLVHDSFSRYFRNTKEPSYSALVDFSRAEPGVPECSSSFPVWIIMRRLTWGHRLTMFLLKRYLAGITCLLDYCIVKDTWLIGSSCRVRSCCNYFGVLNLLNLHLPKSPVKKSRVSHCTQKANYLWHALYWQYKICVNMTFTKNTMRMQKFVFRRLNFRLIFVTCSSCFFNWASVLS